MFYKLCATAFLFMMSNGVFAASSEIVINNAWARVAGKMAHSSAVYMSIENYADEDNALVKVESPVARIVEMHRSYRDDKGVYHMDKQEKIPLLRKHQVILKPGGLHIMLMGLERPLPVGSEIPVTLTFEKGVAKTMRIQVKAPMQMLKGK